jgi:ABC-2 type transport system ATP-binding protein
MPALEVRELRKAYGPVQALQGVSLSVGKGEIYGLLGRNGAGKTTLVKILLSIVRSTSGEARLLDLPVSDPKARERVGYLPEDHRFPDYHTAESALDYYGALSGVPAVDRRRRIPELLKQMELSDAASRKIRTYSKGMKQRLGLAQAILHDPDVVFLDEPTDGVDPVGRKQVRELLLELKSRGKTIFLNSHLLSEVERVCDRVGIMEKGKLVMEGTVESLTGTRVGQVRVEGLSDDAWTAVRASFPAMTRSADLLEFPLEEGKSIDGVIDLLRAKGVSVRGVSEKKRSLEDIFIDTVTEPPRP